MTADNDHYVKLREDILNVSHLLAIVDIEQPFKAGWALCDLSRELDRIARYLEVLINV